MPLCGRRGRAMSGKPGTLPKEHLREIAARGGRGCSAAKLAAVVANGVRGGRPRMFVVRMGIRQALEPAGRADGRVMWGAVVRRVIADGADGFVAKRTDGGGVCAIWNGGRGHTVEIAGLWDGFSRDVARVLRTTGNAGEYRGVVRAVRLEFPDEDWRMTVRVSGCELRAELSKK